MDFDIHDALSSLLAVSVFIKCPPGLTVGDEVVTNHHLQQTQKGRRNWSWHQKLEMGQLVNCMTRKTEPELSYQGFQQ